MVISLKILYKAKKKNLSGWKLLHVTVLKYFYFANIPMHIPKKLFLFCKNY